MAEEIHLQGLLIPRDWHSNGRVKSLVLATDDEQEIIISTPLKGEMIQHLRQRRGVGQPSKHPQTDLAQLDHPADGVLVGEHLVGNRPADDNYLGRIPGIEISDAAATEQRDADGLEIARRDHPGQA